MLKAIEAAAVVAKRTADAATLRKGVVAKLTAESPSGTGRRCTAGEMSDV